MCSQFYNDAFVRLRMDSLRFAMNSVGSRSVIFSSSCFFSLEFCLFVELPFFVCISLIHTDKFIFQFHFAHIMYLVVFNLFMLRQLLLLVCQKRVWPEAPMQCQKMRTNEHVCVLFRSVDIFRLNSMFNLSEAQLPRMEFHFHSVQCYEL